MSRLWLFDAAPPARGPNLGRRRTDRAPVSNRRRRGALLLAALRRLAGRLAGR